MKTYINLRNSAGATLGLVAVLILVILAVGVFVYFGGRLISGNHQLNMASDAGILNATKQSLVRPAVSLNDRALLNNTGNSTSWPYKDFFALGRQKISGEPAIDLVTYNRCVAQAIIVCANATVINNDAALSHACQVAEAVRCLGNRLQILFKEGKLDQYYLEQANANNMNMLGGETPEISLNPNQPHLQPCYAGVEQQLNSNVWLDPSILPNSNQVHYVDGCYVYSGKGGYTVPLVNKAHSLQPNTQTDPNFPADAQKRYLAGYAPITVLRDLNLDVGNTLATRNASEILHTVPVLPQQCTHLLDIDRAVTVPPDALTPPNAFKATARSNGSVLSNSTNRSTPPDNNNTDGGGGDGPTGGPTAGSGSSGNLYVNAVSCAIVGCGDKDYVACIPAGFIRIRNGPDMNTSAPNGVAVDVCYDASDILVNTAALEPTNFIYVATPLPLFPDGTLDKAHMIFGTSDKEAKAFEIQSRFNTTLADNRNDVVNGNKRRISLDPLAYVGIPDGRGGVVGPKPTMWWMSQDPDAPGKGNPNLTMPDSVQVPGHDIVVHVNIREGTGLNQKAILADIQQMTGYMELSDMSFDGSSSISGYSPDVIRQVLETVASNLGSGEIKQGTPGGADTAGAFVTNASASNHGHGFTAIEYYKQMVLDGFNRNVVHLVGNGHELYTFKPNESGMKYFEWFNDQGQVSVSSPNNRFHREFPGSAAAQMETPSSSQFGWIAPPWDYMFAIHQIITHSGGYNPGQVTLLPGGGGPSIMDAILQRCRQINPSYTMDDLIWTNSDRPEPANALGAHPGGHPSNQAKWLDLGQTLYLHADQNTGKLVLDNNVPYDTGVRPEGTGSVVALELQESQKLLLSGTLINTAIKEGTPRAMTGDCNVHESPWRDESDVLHSWMGARFTPATGYNNLLGELTFYQRVDAKTIFYHHAN